MSGDLGAEVVVRAAKLCLDRHPNLRLILVGDAGTLEALVTRIVGNEPRLTIRGCSEVIEMSEPPVEALRRKKDSSMRVAIDLVKEGQAQACVSAGNTGALMAIAKFVLKMLPGIDRPAIIAELPSIGGSVHMLDLGANTVNDPEQRQYQLWIFDRTRKVEQPVDGGVFDIPAGSSEVIIPIDAKVRVHDAFAFAVTVEKPGGVVVSEREHIVVMAGL